MAYYYVSLEHSMGYDEMLDIILQRSSGACSSGLRTDCIQSITEITPYMTPNLTPNLEFDTEHANTSGTNYRTVTAIVEHAFLKEKLQRRRMQVSFTTGTQVEIAPCGESNLNTLSTRS
jgi:hypothetical protein